MATEVIQNIPARLKNVATNGHVAGAVDIIDDTKGKTQDVINADVDTAIGTDSTEGSIKGRIKSLETLVGSTSVDSQIDNKINALDATASQTASTDGLALSVTETNGKVTAISGSIAAGTYATLEEGKVPASQLPAYVDDVIEGYYYNSKFWKEAAHTTEITPEAGKIYVDLASNLTYRWGGSAYVEISQSLALGETSGTAYEGSKGKTVADKVTVLEAAVGSGGSVDTRIAAAKTEVIGGATSNGNTLKKLEDRISPVETAVGTGGSVDSRISSAVNAAKSEIKGTATSACDTLGEAEALISAEASRAQASESALQNNIEALTQSNIVVVADHTSVSNPDPYTIYREQGTNTYSDWMYQNGSWMKMAEYDNAIDDEPTGKSDNLVKSGGVAAANPIKTIKQDYDFSVADQQGKTVLVIENGEIKTKNFDSRDINLSKESYEADLIVSDYKKNVILALEGGGIKTKNFDSRNVSIDNQIYMPDFVISDYNHKPILMCENGGIEVKNFNSSLFKTNILKGKKVAFLGDSITHGAFADPYETKRYSALFCSALGCEEHNYGVNGASFAPIAGTTNLIKTQVTQQNIEGMDLIFVWGGTNDFTYNINPIGQPFSEVSQPESSTWAPKRKVPNQDTNCFCGGVVDVITSIRAINPNARLVFINILNRGNYYNGTGQERRPSSAESNSHNEYVQDYRKAVKELCEFYAIPVVDMNDLFNQDWQNNNYPTRQLSSLTADGLHPNTAGHKRIAEILVKWILSNMII